MLSRLVLLTFLAVNVSGCDRVVPEPAGRANVEPSDSSDVAEQFQDTSVVEAPVIEAVETIPLFDKYGGRMALSADGRRLVASGSDASGEQIVVYDMAAAKTLREFESRIAGVMPVSISRDGTLVAYLSRANFVKVVNVETEVELHEFKNDLLTSYYSHHLQIAPDGKSVWIHVWGALTTTNLLGWSLETGEALPELGAEGLVATCLSIFPDSTRIVAGYENGEVRVWDVTTGKSEQISTGGVAPIRAVAVSPSGNYVAAGIIDRQPRVWNTETKALVHTLQVGGMQPSTSLSFDPTESVVVCQGNWLGGDGQRDFAKKGDPIHVFDVQSGQRLASLDLPESPNLPSHQVWGNGWSGTSHYVFIDNGTIYEFDLSSIVASASQYTR